MKSFTEFLTESRAAPLYHGTSSLFAASQILEKGFMPLSFHDKKLIAANKNVDRNAYPKQDYLGSFANGVSFSRSFRGASLYAGHRHESIPQGLRIAPKPTGSGGKGVVIEVDQQKLAQRFKIVPLDWSNGTSLTANRIDAQEFAVTKKNIPPSVIKTIWVPTLEGIDNFIKQAKSKGVEVKPFSEHRGT